MVDFNRMGSSGSKKKAASLQDTFSRLDRQVSHVELRPSQIKIFEQLDSRAEDHDLVVKLNTGGGKTTTGLIYLKHKMDQYGEPVVYLVPTVQLANQVVDEGAKVGIRAIQWIARESYPPEDALRCRAVIVCTYDKFFNGKSTFARADVRLTPAAIVMDDVHAGVEAVRKCFSAVLPEEAREKIIQMMKADLQATEPAAWIRIENNDSKGMLEVPHWVFQSHLESLRAILSRYQEGDLIFSWPHISKNLDLCRLVISGASAVIVQDPAAIENIQHYVGARHRLFMSASIQDGAALVRELGCDPESAGNPIDIPGEGSVGERMVIVPSLADPDFSRDQLAEVVRNFAGETNVVVLVASSVLAEFWKEAGAQVVLGDDVPRAVSNLRSTKRGGFYVFVQRYDGIDLPDDACRLLVLDGLPQGEGLIDRFDSEILGGFVGMRGKVANRVEQGLGRSVRSSSDYCAVLLAGRDLANFLSRRVVLENFSPLTVRQIEVGRDVSEEIAASSDKVQAVVETVRQCLGRDPSWRDYYIDQISEQSDISKSVAEEATTNLDVARYERLALSLALARDYSTSAEQLQRAVNLRSKDRAQRGVLKQSMAKVLYHVDRVEAMQIQAAAYGDNVNLSRPPTLPSKYERRITTQAEGIAGWIREFSDKKGALVEIDQLRSRLAYANDFRAVEDAIERLGMMLGAESSRPEKEENRGPDNLWVFGEVAFCIEMKNEKGRVLSKADAGQLRLSLEWSIDRLPKTVCVYPIIGSNCNVADVVDDFPKELLVFKESGVMELLESFRKLIVALIAEGPLFSEDAGNIQKQLGPHKLLPKQIRQVGCGLT